MSPRPGPHFKTLYLKPGEVFRTAEPALITTVLGSCISITMHHKSTGLSIMCHAVMPRRTEARKSDPGGSDIFQYVDSSLEWMILQYEKTGIKLGSIQVKMFGGAAMFMDAQGSQKDMSVGKRNIETATAILEKNRMPLTAWNVGGSQGRKLVFNTLNGEVLARFIAKAVTALPASGGKK